MPEDRAPSVAVVIPCRDEAPTIAACIRSLRAQVPPPVSITVVDDGSSDGSGAIAEELADAVLRPGARTTIAGLRNLGARASEAEVVAFVDADCEVRPGWLAAGLASLEGADLTGFRVEAPPSGSWVARGWGGVEQRLAGNRPVLWSANMMVARRAFDALGGFDERLRTGEDVDLSRRAVDAGLTVTLDPAMRVVHHGFPATLAGFVRRERWHASTPGWWGALSGRGRLLVLSSGLLAAAGAVGAIGGLAGRRAWLVGGAASLVLGSAGLGVATGGRRHVFRDGLLLLVWGLARLSRLPRGVRRP